MFKKTSFVPLFFFTVLILFISSCRSSKTLSYADIKYPKREFRGAWFSTVWQERYRNMNSEQMKTFFERSLDSLQHLGINAIIFQVRPQADAFYKSKYEPWSAHLSGQQGKAPDSGFDPLEFVIDECHQRGMELHAWINPYRVTTSPNDKLVSNHLYYRRPDLFVTYGKKIYFDPGIKENRTYICTIVKDIVLHYNVDAIHMDDYFYPYPIAGESFPDDKSFRANNRGFTNKGDWRRDNVNLLIKEVKETLMSTKPWVRFGISPFGIYRNKKSTSDGSGSETNGLQNFDDLYADIKLWVKNGWVDYNMPQIYWEIGHKLADYTTLIHWWAENNYNKHLYIGQDAERMMNAQMAPSQNQLSLKLLQERELPSIHGMCFWPAYPLLENYKGIYESLKSDFLTYPSLIPAYTDMSTKTPKKVNKLKAQDKKVLKRTLTWESNADPNDPLTAFFYVIYKFRKNEKVDISRAQNIVSVTSNPYYVLPEESEKEHFKYAITVLDRFNNESKPRIIKVKY